jgi:(1->4)-alpha-D-glucan 1-alpha-D-glucosylmutase
LCRAQSLEQKIAPPNVIADWGTGAVKQRLIATILNHRAQSPQIYSDGDYVPLTASGTRAAHVVAFERRIGGARLVCVASRWAQSLAGPLTLPLIESNRWEDTALSVEPGKFVDVLADGPPVTLDGTASIAELLRRFPVALLFARSENG